MVEELATVLLGKSGKKRGPSASTAFAPLIVAGWEALDNLHPDEVLPAGAVLTEQEKSVRHIYLIKSGLVRISRVSAEGKEMILGLRSEGWMPGLVSWASGTTPAISVRTVTPCRVWMISAEQFAHQMGDDRHLAGHVTRVLSLEAASQYEVQAGLRGDSAERRLDRFLSEKETLLAEWEFDDQANWLKQSELAQLLSITPEHLSRLQSRKKSNAFGDRQTRSGTFG